jgi:FHA domain
MASGRELRIIIEEREFRLAPMQQVIIGRDPSAGIVVSGHDVSRQHLRLYDSPSGWMLQDLNSANGTWIGGQRVNHTTIGAFVLVTLGHREGPTVIALEPVPVTRPQPSPPRDREPSQPLFTVITLAFGILLIAVGLFALDWYRADIVIDGQLQTTASVSEGVELDADGLGVAAAALGGAIGILGLRSSISHRPLGLIVLLTSMITAATTAYLMFGPPADDQFVSVPGLTATAEVSADIGGFVTLAGAVAVGVAGIALLLGPASR